MIPTSTRASVKLSKTAPTRAGASAVFVHKQGGSGGEYPSLPQPESAALDRLLKASALRGKSNEVTFQVLDVTPARQLVVIGLGDRARFSAQCLREAGAALAKAAAKHRIADVTVFPPAIPAELPGVPSGASEPDGVRRGIQSLVEGLLLGGFEFEEYYGTAKRTRDDGKAAPVAFTIVSPQDAAIREAVDRGRVIAEGQNFARTIASRPGNVVNPPALAKIAEDLAREIGVACRVLDEKQMRQLGMGGILAVGAGSVNTPPRMIVLEYPGSGQSRSSTTGSKKRSTSAADNPLLVVGKAITFDTGGISIKPADKMGKMIFDKCGAMAVLGMMYVVAKLKLPVRVVGILASAENILSESAYRPGDILKMYNGVTVEVTNTDAEGRLVLGDALAWGIETYKPAAVVDLATLTGGVVVALGKTMAGVMSNSDPLVAEFQRAADLAGEKIWRLPIWDEHREQMKSDAADLVNSAPGRDAAPLQGGAFLSYFVPWSGDHPLPWAHLDIAGVSDTEKDLPLYARGATGWGVRTLVEWAENRRAK